jgi:DNA modification methylase
VVDTIIQGDALTVLKTLPDEFIDCCVTSPPYWGLRDYGVECQLGLEKTPEEYVAKMVEVFREVRRVLKKEGTLWLNLGDSYAGGGRASGQGLKPKDLVGIPWRVAFALQASYYKGKIKNELDRMWAAAMLDAEGNISVSQYETNGRQKSNIYITITNSSMPIIEKCDSLFEQDMKHIYEKSAPLNVPVFRWDVERIENKAMFIREIYPYLVAKKKQAILGYTFLDMQKALFSKKKGYLLEQQEKRGWISDAMSKLNHGESIDLPNWVIEPPSLYEQGFYLRQDIIWSKPNPMPESVTDRCTKAHEYVFLLTKSARYYYDQEAIKEPVKDSSVARLIQDVEGQQGSSRVPGKTNGPMKAVRFGGNKQCPDTRLQSGKEWNPKMAGGGTNISGHAGYFKADGTPFNGLMVNKKSVWTITTKPFKEAHFATFPEDLIRPMILAGCPEGGIVLDPFIGSGTVARVAVEHRRHYIGIDLNTQYVEMAEKRRQTTQRLFV